MNTELNIQRFAKRPSEVQAVFVTEDRLPEIAAWCGGYTVETLKRSGTGYVHVPAGVEVPPGGMRANVGDWIIRAEDGTFYCSKPEQFWATYEYAGQVTHPGQLELDLDL